MLQSSVELRPTQPADLPILFELQLDEEAVWLAAFMPPNYSDAAAYLEKHARFLRDPTIHAQTIVLDGAVVGSLAKFELEGEAEITYWLDRRYWGQGVGTAALRQFLLLEPARPLHARVAYDNLGSQNVLTKCGFVKTGVDQGFASARQAVIEEYLYRLAY